jgi:hypothetical protein
LCSRNSHAGTNRVRTFTKRAVNIKKINNRISVYFGKTPKSWSTRNYILELLKLKVREL